MRISCLKRAVIRLLVVSLLFLWGCIVVPKAVEDRNLSCKLETKELTLDIWGSVSMEGDQLVKELTRLSTTKCDKPECLLILAPIVTVSVGSAIVSGSIVIIGNTVHWLEKEGRCGAGVINQAVTGLRDLTVNAGGWVVETTGDLVDFFADYFEN